MDPNQHEDSDPDPPKLPFRRLKYALERVVSVAIPFHIQLLNEQSERIEQLAQRPLELRSEQLKASNTVKLLKQDLFELENLNRQVRDEDQERFQKSIEKSLKNAVEVLSAFMYVHSDVLGPLLDIDNDTIVDSPEFPEVVCDPHSLNQDENDSIQPEQLQVSQLQVRTGSKADAWSFLRKELVELHSLIRKFSTLVFGQQEHIDTIENNILQTRENVREGTEHLRKASLLKAASFPIAGALIGGAILGPIGALVGLKLVGCVGCIASGSALGYTAGTRIKKRQQNALEGIEMKALTYPSKSNSVPDLLSSDRKSN